MALTTCRVLLSAYILFKDVYAHIKAGIHPIRVIWRIRHTKPEIIFPCKNNESHGRKKAITYLIVF